MRTRGARRWLAGAALSALTLGLAGAPAWAASYTVQPGDTYWSLARLFGTTVQALEALNPGVPAWNLYPGLVLQVPGGGGGSPAGPLGQAAKDLIAQLAVAEEGGRSFTDLVGVADVVLNRLQSGQFPSTVAGVIFQPGQFTSVANGWFYQVSPTPQALRAVAAALSGYDPTHGALYFYDPGPDVTDPWIYTRSVTAVIDGTVYAR